MPKWVTFSGDGYKPMGTGAWRYLNPAYLTKDENDKVRTATTRSS